jgi:hypothetical protein
MANETLEQRSYVTVERDSRELKPVERNTDSLVVYRPENTSVELEVESYSAMQYHGQ